MIAAAVADLTDGMLFSDDGGWEYERFPATATEFRSWYFVSEHALDDDQRRWTERCIEVLKEQYS